MWFKELERQNFRPEIYGTTNSGSPAVRDGCGNLVVGTKVYQFSPGWLDTDAPIISKLHELNSKWHPEVTWRPAYYIRGFAGFFAAAEALNRAVNNVGYPNLNSDAVKEAMETIKDFDPLGYGAGYTWTPADHHGLHAIRWYKWTEELTMVPASNWEPIDPLPAEQKTDSWWYKD